MGRCAADSGAAQLTCMKAREALREDELRAGGEKGVVIIIIVVVVVVWVGVEAAK